MSSTCVYGALSFFICDSINRPGDLDFWPFDLWIGSRVTRMIGFHPSNFALPRPFHSRVRSREAYATDRQTDGWTDGQIDTAHHFIMPLPGRSGHNKSHGCNFRHAMRTCVNNIYPMRLLRTSDFTIVLTNMPHVRHEITVTVTEMCNENNTATAE